VPSFRVRQSGSGPDYVKNPWIMSLSFNVRPSESGRNAGLAMNGAVRFLETLSRFSVSSLVHTFSVYARPYIGVCDE
jgi:hypothetical protein